MPSVDRAAKVKPVDPRIRPLELERQRISDRPSVFELTQLTATCASSLEWKNFWNKSKDPHELRQATEAAISIWGYCALMIRDKIDDDIRNFSWDYDSHESKLQEAELFGKFPMGFENALKLIVGGQGHLSDRYSFFRSFLRVELLNQNEDGPKIESQVENEFLRLKAEGVSQVQLIGLASSFALWKISQSSVKASKAAKARWNKAKK